MYQLSFSILFAAHEKSTLHHPLFHKKDKMNSENDSNDGDSGDDEVDGDDFENED